MPVPSRDIDTMKRLLIHLIMGCTVLMPLASRAATDTDPFEGLNRGIYQFNKVVDDYFLKPIATAYKTILPWPLTKGISNFYSNLNQIPIICNDLLQFELYQATSDSWRFAINSTIGIFGLVDVASHIGLEKNTEDFGLTLAKWGYNSSAYLVLPILGPSTVRDAIGLPVDYELFSVYPQIASADRRHILLGLNIINQRANLLEYDDVMKHAALDPYSFQRNAYLQRRAYLIEQNKPQNNELDVEDDKT